MIIGLVGFIGAGKGTFANQLMSEGFIAESFAKPLKDAVATIFNWNRSLVEGDTAVSRRWRDEIDHGWTKALGWDVTPRKVLQLMGTEAGRNVFGKALWTSALLRRMDDSLNYVITDARFANEIQALRTVGANIIRIRRGPEPEWLSQARELLAFEAVHEPGRTDRYRDNLLAQLPHRSEWDWALEPIDTTIDNDGSVDDLKWQAHRLIEQLRNTP